METMPPQKKRRRAADYIYIPTELVEKVLLNLPVKSLTRFSTVSKSWNSTIHSRDFAKRYRGREMIVVKPSSDPDAGLVYPFSSILSRNTMVGSRRRLFIYPRLRASCGELWCVEFEGGTVCLYNPTMQACRILPASTSTSSNFSYGLGYDSATDDYKVLKLDIFVTGKSELYSQRSDSWRMISDLGSREESRSCLSSHSHDQKYLIIQSKKGVFVNGLLHWIPRCIRCGWDLNILSFDLSTEKYGEVAMPESEGKVARVSELSVLRGKVCVYSDDDVGGVLWVHDEGVWSKEVVIINYPKSNYIFPNYEGVWSKWRFKPLYSYNNNIKAFVVSDISKIFLRDDESTQLVEKDFGCGIFKAFTYVESMVKP